MNKKFLFLTFFIFLNSIIYSRPIYKEVTKFYIVYLIDFELIQAPLESSDINERYLAANASCQNINVNLDATGNATIAEDAVNLGSTGNGPLTFDTDITTFSCADIGTPVTVTLTVTDSDPSSSSCTATVTVFDNLPPTASNLDPVNVQCDADLPIIDINDVTTESDNCGILNVSHVSDVSDNNSCPEVITRTYRVTDTSGNIVDVTQTITVDDTIIPELAAAPIDVTVACLGDVPAMTDLTWTDNCDGTGTVTGTDSALSGGNECGGTITRTWNYTDGCGNLAATRTQIITVDDDTNPTASNPAPQNVQCFSDIIAPNINVVTNEADNCTTNPVVAFVSDVSDGNTCPEVITRTYSVTDDCGNSINVTQTITVDDTIIPELAAAPIDVTVACLGDVPAMTDLTWTDNCDGTGTVTGTDSALSGGNECGGTITRTWNYTDGCGNLAATRTQIITVDDDTNPTASNPAPQNVQCFSDIIAPNINVVTNEADNCTTNPVVAFVSDVSDGNTCPEVITRTYSVTDDCGNSINVTQTITVDDTIIPELAAAPIDVTVACLGDVPAMTDLTWTDNCDGTGTVTGTDSALSGGNECGGTITRTWNYTDGCGNLAATRTQIITVDDDTNPTASNPAPQNVQCFSDIIAPNINVVTNEADNCTTNPVVAFVSDVSDGNTCPEVITRTYSVTDDCGNSINVTQTITVDDTIIPELAAAPIDVTVACLGDVPAMTDLTWTDNCDGTGTVTGTDSALSGGNECGGTITRTWNYTDGCGNLAATRTQIITVDDDTNPTASNPAPQNVQCFSDIIAPNINVVTNEADNCTTNPVVAFVSDVSDGNTCPEVITRTYSVTDDCGNSINVTQTITVDDTIIPELAAAPIDVTVACLGDVPAMTDLTWTDNCDGTGTVTGTDSALSGGNECGGTITRTWNYTDGCGNLAATRTQIITVDDDTNPTASNPAPQNVQCFSDIIAPNINVVTNEADNCTTNPVVAFVSDVSDGNTCPEVITRTYSVTDDCGNSINVTQTITVDDTIIPELAAAPIDVTVACLGDVPAMTDLTWTDNCDGTGTVTGTDSALSGGNECGGTITRTWNYTDGCGNLAATRTQIITVDDDTNPTASNLAPQNVQCFSDIIAPNINVVTNEADNCTTNPVVAFVSDVSDGNTCPEVITRTYSVTDDCGNSINVTQTITVDDTIIPELAAAPIDVTVACLGDVPAMTDLTWTDNCDGTGTVTGTDSALSGGNECGGTITRTWNYTDGCGNLAATRTQIITVDDDTNPTASNPAPQNVQCFSDIIAPNINVVTNEADNCTTNPVVAFVSDVSDGNTCPEVITRTYSVTDDCGNSINVTQTITVDDTIIPVLAAAPIDVTVACLGDVPAMTDLTWTDNCDGTGTVTGTDSALSGGNECGGTITRTWNYTDACGNTAITRTQIITLDDTTNPSASNPAPISAQCTLPAPNVALVIDEADNCGTPTVTHQGDVSNNNSCPEIVTRTYRVTDACGNFIDVQQTITIDDTINPTASNPAPISAQCTLPAPNVALVIDEADNCGTPTVTHQGDVSNNNSCPEIVTRTYRVTDACGNFIDVQQTITIDDTINPTASSPAPINVQCNGNVPPPNVNVITNEADNCGTPVVTFVSDVSNGASNPEVITRTYRVTDTCGNFINVTQNIVINDTIDPEAICQNITIPLNDTTGTATITPNQINNGSNDNCGSLTFTLSQSTFDCTNIGPNIIVLTATDTEGNTDTCTATVTVTSPNISGGTATGYLNNNQTAADADNLVEVTACPDEPQNATLLLTGESGNIIRWESSINGGLNWTSIANTTNTYYFADIMVTTLIRAVIQIGSCQAYSSIVIVAVIPPDVPPTIIGDSEFDVCLGEAVTVVAESSFGIIPDFNEGGTFNQANPEGWDTDGLGHIPANADNGNNTIWAETNGPKKFAGRCYDTTDNTKFAIAVGVAGGTFSPNTYLETPVFNTLGLTTATLDFEQAYYLTAGAWCLIELSVDGGATYPTVLDPGASYNYIGPSDTGFLASVPGFTGQCNNTIGTRVDKPVSIDLQNYIGLVNLRVRFTFHGTVGSAWALDNIRIPQAPVDEVIQWTDETGTVVTTGASTTITPVTPGVQTYGVTSLINGCRADGDEGTEFISMNVSLSYAGKNIAPIAGECGEKTVQLNAYNNSLTAAQNIANGAFDNNYVTGTYPGTGEAGSWSVVTSPTGCGSASSFSNNGSPNSTFTGEAGTYILRWTVAGCASDVEVTLDNCDSIDFDGINDYITFDNNYNLANQFSIETWIKPESVSGIQTIFSKRNANNLATGYDLKLTNGIISFNWNSTGTIVSPFNISTNRWYHIAITYNSGTYKLYIDGIELNNSGGVLPANNSQKCLLGAMDQSGNPPNKPVNYYNGWIDELRIWNKTLTTQQIRLMMNQEIMNNTAVRGVVVPLDVAGLLWTDLDGYYRMAINCGKLTPTAGTVDGKIRNTATAQEETAPIPYTSRIDGQLWTTDNTWTNFPVWDVPNSLGLNGTPIDWNIVRVSHNINSGNKDIIVLGLISDSVNKELTITDPGTPQNETNDGQSLRVTHYLKLDGNIDLVGESQLLQDEGSILAVNSAGKLERDQQGLTNLFNYDYWSSFVGPQNTSTNNNAYSVNGVLRDGTNTNNPINVQWTNSYDANGSTTPVTLSRSWLYTYENYLSDSYPSWRLLNENDLVNVGLGFTMKGSGVGNIPYNALQNYVFIGKPNNGTITTPVTTDNQALVGNPYPSAIDAREFIKDNLPGGSGNPGTSSSIDGSLYFWEHYTTNYTHYLEDYEGGYAVYNLSGGVAAVSPPLISGNGASTKFPQQYIPVGQGFFVTSSNFAGAGNSLPVTFKNSQRAFIKETSGNSMFFRSSNPNLYAIQNNETQADEDLIKRVRIEFTTPEGSIRPLLLSFVSDGFATDGVDYGYDAPNTDDLPNDMSWIIEGERYVIQGVGRYNQDIEYQFPIGIYLANGGNIEISLSDLENFEEDVINVYVYDSLLGIYTLINNFNYINNLDSETYLNRFYISFSTDSSLSVIDNELEQVVVNFLNDSDEIFIKTPNSINVRHISLINIIGQTILTWKSSEFNNSNELRIPVNSISEGTYIIKVETNTNTFNKKVIIKF